MLSETVIARVRPGCHRAVFVVERLPECYRFHRLAIVSRLRIDRTCFKCDRCIVDNAHFEVFGREDDRSDVVSWAVIASARSRI